MSTIRYTKDHEWIRAENGEASVGISDYAQEQLGDIVYVELPQPGRRVAQAEEVAVVESVKAASEIYAPASGEILAVNEGLNEDPGIVNAEPLGAGWFFRLRLDDPAELDRLMDEAAYRTYTAGLEQ